MSSIYMLIVRIILAGLKYQHILDKIELDVMKRSAEQCLNAFALSLSQFSPIQKSIIAHKHIYMFISDIIF